MPDKESCEGKLGGSEGGLGLKSLDVPGEGKGGAGGQGKKLGWSTELGSSKEVGGKTGLKQSKIFPSRGGYFQRRNQPAGETEKERTEISDH